jgi:hypothetical protein
LHGLIDPYHAGMTDRDMSACLTVQWAQPRPLLAGFRKPNKQDSQNLKPF